MTISCFHTFLIFGQTYNFFYFCISFNAFSFNCFFTFFFVCILIFVAVVVVILLPTYFFKRLYTGGRGGP